MVEAAGADLVDINFGCSVRKVTKTGAGATLLDDPDRACRIVSAVAEAVDVPVSVKMRRGLENGSRACLDVGPRLVDVGAATLTLHPRSAKQMYTGEADHALTAEFVELVGVPVIASGDITSRARRRRCSPRLGPPRSWSDGPRRATPGCCARSWATSRSRPGRKSSPSSSSSCARRSELGEHRATGFLKKFYSWYLGRGRFPRPFKQELVELQTFEEVASACSRPRPARDSSWPASRKSYRRATRSRSTSRISIYGGG